MEVSGSAFKADVQCEVNIELDQILHVGKSDQWSDVMHPKCVTYIEKSINSDIQHHNAMKPSPLCMSSTLLILPS